MKRFLLILLVWAGAQGYADVADWFSWNFSATGHVGLVGFNTNNVPDFVRKGQEVTSLTRLVGGVQMNVMPWVGVVTASWDMKEGNNTNITMREWFLSYYGSDFSLHLGKQKQEWGEGHLFRPLYTLDFVQADTLGESLDLPPVYEPSLVFSYYLGQWSATARGIYDEGIVSNKSAWSSYVLSVSLDGETYHASVVGAFTSETNTTNFQKRILTAGEVSYFFTPDISIGVSCGLTSSLEEKTNEIRSLVYGNFGFLDKNLLFFPEVGYERERVLLSLGWSLSFFSKQYTLGGMVFYETKDEGRMIVGTLAWHIDQFTTVSLGGRYIDGDKKSCYSSETLRWSTSLNIEVKL